MVVNIKKIASKNKRREFILSLRRPLVRLCMMPAFLIIGAQKSGTSSLYNYLIQHPDIIPPVMRPKELHYFDLHYERGPHWYLSNFPFQHPGKITGEKSPYYLYHPLVPERVASFNKNLKLIVLMRDPVKRAYSHYNHQIRKGRESRPFRIAVEAEMDNVDLEHGRLAEGEIKFSFIHRHYSYFARGHYAEQLDLWMRFFPRKNFYLVTSERFFKDTQAVCSEIFGFLGLPPAAISTANRHNTGTYEPIPESDQKWLADLFRQSNKKLAESYAVNIDDWLQ